MIKETLKEVTKVASVERSGDHWVVRYELPERGLMRAEISEGSDGSVIVGNRKYYLVIDVLTSLFGWDVQEVGPLDDQVMVVYRLAGAEVGAKKHLAFHIQVGESDHRERVILTRGLVTEWAFECWRDRGEMQRLVRLARGLVHMESNDETLDQLVDELCRMVRKHYPDSEISEQCSIIADRLDDMGEDVRAKSWRKSAIAWLTSLPTV